MATARPTKLTVTVSVANKLKIRWGYIVLDNKLKYTMGLYYARSTVEPLYVKVLSKSKLVSGIIPAFSDNSLCPARFNFRSNQEWRFNHYNVVHQWIPLQSQWIEV
jgi:hypothetical protein